MHRCTATMVPYRSFTPPNEILCGDFQAEFKITGIAMPDLQYLISPSLCQNASVLHGKICKLKHVICMQTMEKLAKSYWTERVQLFKDYYPILPT